jgi:hypothetical protein
MSRIIGYHLNGVSAGEVHASCTRGWAINDGGEARITLVESDLADWLDFGRMVLVEHAKLPAWVGMIDPPWDALLPVGVTLYPAEYLLAQRTPEEPMTLHGSPGQIALQLVEMANAQEDLLIRPGEVDLDEVDRDYEIDQRTLWVLLQELATETGMEMQIRPARDLNNHLVLFFDFKRRLGVDTNFLFQSTGDEANIEITQLTVDGDIWNSIIGIGSQSSKASRLQVGPVIDEGSINHYRLRSKVVQYSGVTVDTTLLQSCQVELENCRQPFLKIRANALDVGETFANIALGNTGILHVANARLPGGVRGWRGIIRITAMEYDEATNKVGMNLEAAL